MSNAQHRCVFVGNIPYDATEKELIRICEEVGPVVSFRVHAIMRNAQELQLSGVESTKGLVVDRDTGKPKGYGFCEYRDEETALSARRNLQGYEINGRQLRVDFAENEKGSADRNREQGRGGPGLVDVSKQNVGAKVSRDPSLNQPVGLPAAASAAAVMAGMLGAPQMPMGTTAAPGAGRPPIGLDALTVHLANMSRYQLYDILNQMKNFIQQNQQQARQILTSNPQLVKALFQAQVMLGLTQQPLQIPQTQNMLQPPLLAVPQGPNVGQMQPQPQPQGAPQSQPQRPPHNVNFQVPSHPQQQMNPRPGPPLLPPQPMQAPPPSQSSMGLPPQAMTMQRTQPQPPMHMNPPLPQQARPILPSSPPQAAQGAGFQYGQQPQHSQIQQPGGLPPPSSLPFQGMPPPLPNQPPPQHLQASRPVDGAGSAGIMPGGMKVPTSLNEATQPPSTSAPFGNWNQLPPSGSLMGPPSAPPSAMPVASMPMGSNYPNVGPTHNNPGAIRSAPNEGSAVANPKEGNQQPPVQPPSQQQSQVPLDAQQHMALLQQVMNLTPEQINSLPAETRQQVLDLQQAFRSQGIPG